MDFTSLDSARKCSVSFTDFEVIFECNSVHHRESIPIKIKDFEAKHYHGLLGQPLGVHIDPMIDPDHSYTFADQLIEEFTGRHLSFQEDALNACLGILRHWRVHHSWGVLVQPPHYPMRPYCSIQLDWTTHKPGRRRENFPSWSWASTIGRADMGYMSPYRGSFRECDVYVPRSDGNWQTIEEWSRDDDFVEVFQGPCIRITGSVLSIRRRKNPADALSEARNLSYDIETKGTSPTPNGYITYVSLDCEEDDEMNSTKIFALVWYTGSDMHRSPGLLILLKPTVNGYRRIGTARWSGFSTDLLIPEDSRLTFDLY